MRKIMVLAMIVAVLVMTANCELRDSGKEYARAMGKTYKRADKIQIESGIAKINHAIQSFETDNLRKPDSLQELVDSRYLAKIPVDRFGGEYIYDSRTGEVTNTTLPKIEAEIAEIQKRSGK